jgi:hypothetical protein
MNNNNIPHQNTIQDFLEFSRNFNNTMQQMLRTYNTISESYHTLLTSSQQQQNLPQRNEPRNNVRVNPPNTYYPYSPLYTFPIGGFMPNTRNVQQTRNTRNAQRNNLDNIWNLFNGANTGFNWNTFMEPVAVVPTRQQIDNAIENVTYGTIDTEQQHCPIDLIPFEDGEELVRIRHCQHIFRRNNLTGWFSTSYRCPLCRYDIRSYQNNTGADADADASNNDEPIEVSDISGNTETTDTTETNTDVTSQTTLSNGNTFTTTTQNNGNPLQNTTTIQIDTGVVPLNFNINDQTQTQLGNAITDTIMQTFQGLLDPSGNAYNVDYQYNLFNNGNNTN